MTTGVEVGVGVEVAVGTVVVWVGVAVGGTVPVGVGVDVGVDFAFLADRQCIITELDGATDVAIDAEILIAAQVAVDLDGSADCCNVVGVFCRFPARGTKANFRRAAVFLRF
mgnify:CR=1 FL=1